MPLFRMGSRWSEWGCGGMQRGSLELTDYSTQHPLLLTLYSSPFPAWPPKGIWVFSPCIVSYFCLKISPSQRLLYKKSPRMYFGVWCEGNESKLYILDEWLYLCHLWIMLLSVHNIIQIFFQNILWNFQISAALIVSILVHKSLTHL